MILYVARIYLEDEVVEMPPTSSFAQALEDKMHLNREYEGLYIQEAKIYTYEI